MVHKPVLGLAGVFVAGLALTGCQSTNNKPFTPPPGPRPVASNATANPGLGNPAGTAGGNLASRPTTTGSPAGLTNAGGFNTAGAGGAGVPSNTNQFTPIGGQVTGQGQGYNANRPSSVPLNLNPQPAPNPANTPAPFGAAATPGALGGSPATVSPTSPTAANRPAAGGDPYPMPAGAVGFDPPPTPAARPVAQDTQYHSPVDTPQPAPGTIGSLALPTAPSPGSPQPASFNGPRPQ
jgi:hypothetical protein